MDFVTKYVAITEEDIREIEDQYFFVLEPMWAKGNIYNTYSIYQQSLEEFTQPQRYLYAMEWLIAEVSNGGFYQFLDSASSIVWQDAYQGFIAADSKAIIELMDKVVEIYGDEPSKVRSQRSDRLMEFDDEQFNQLTEIDGQFYSLSDELYQQMIGYIKANPKAFLFTGVIEGYEE